MNRILVGMLLLSLLLLSGGTLQAQQLPLFGADLIAPASSQWEQHRAMFRQMRGEVVRYRIDDGFSPNPTHIDQLINDGARTIILNTDAVPDYDTVYREFVGQGFWQKVLQYRGVQFYLELGNEPENHGTDLWSYRWYLIDTYDRLQPQVNVPNLGFMVGMPVSMRGVEIVFGDGEVLRRFDALAPHLYGWYALSDAGGGDWLRIYDWSLRTGLPVYLTEVGIDDRNTDKRVKAQRILDWVAKQPAQLRGVMVFAISDPEDQRWPQYRITTAMAEVFASRSGVKPAPSNPCRFFTETNQPLCYGFRDYWESHGGLMIFGYPLTPEIQENGMTVQYFERAVFEYHPHNSPEYQVLLRRLGAEALERARP